MTTTVVTGIRTVTVPVEDQERSLRFFVDTLGFTVQRDMQIPTGRWIELSPGGGDVVVTLDRATPGAARGGIIVRFTTDDAEAAHAALSAAGVEVDEVLRWPGTPAMFGFRDVDGNAFSLTEVA